MGAKKRFRYKKKATRAPMAERVVHDHVAADAEQGGLAQPPHQLGARAVDGVDLGGVDVGVAVLTHDVAVMDDVVPLAVVGGDHPHAVQALGQVGHHVGDAVAHPVVAALGRHPEPQRHEHQGGDDQQHRDEGQLDVGGEEDDRDDDHGEALDGELGQAVLEQLLEVLDVAGHAGHDHARLLGGEEVERQALQVREDLDPEVVHDAGRQPAGDPDLGSLRDRGERHEGRDR